MWLLTLLILAAGSPLVVGDELGGGNFPTVRYPGLKHQTNSIRKAICEDQFGCIYVGDGTGVLRFSGAQWQRVFEGDEVSKLVFNNHGAVYGLLHSGIGKWVPGAHRRLAFSSLNPQIVAAGASNARAFRDLSVVGSDVFATKTGSIARLRVNADGADSVSIFDAKTCLPEEYKFRRVREVNGRAMVQVERHDDMSSCRFGWLMEDGTVSLFEKLTAGDGSSPSFHVVDFTAMNQTDEKVLVVGVISATRSGLFVVEGGKVSEFKVQDYLDTPLYSSHAREIRRLADGSFAVGVSQEGTYLFDAAGVGERHIGPSLTPGNLGLAFEDSAGRLWIPSKTDAYCVRHRANVLLWEISDECIVSDLLCFDGHLVVGTSRGIYAARYSPITNAPVEKFRLLGPKQLEVRSLACVGGELFVSAFSGLFVASSLEDTDPLKRIEGIPYVRQVIASPRADEAFFCHQSGGLRRYNRIEGVWRMTERFATQYTVKNPVVDSRGAIWVVAVSASDKTSTQMILPNAESGATVKTYAVDGVPFLHGGDVYLFSSPNDTLSQTGHSRSESSVLKYDPVDDQFRPDSQFSDVVNHRLANDFRSTAPWIKIGQSADAEFMLSPILEGVFQITRQTCGIEPPLAPAMLSHHFGAMFRQGDSIWFGIDGRVARLRAGAYEPRPEPKPRVFMSHISLLDLDDRSWQDQGRSDESDLVVHPSRDGWNHHVEFGFSNRTLVFEFATPSVAHADGVYFQTRMKGMLDRWSKATAATVREFPALYEGDYTFEVRAILPDGATTVPTRCSITVIPPWYRTTLLKFLYVCLGVLIPAVATRRWLVNKHRQVRRLEREISDRIEAEDQLKQTQAALLKQERIRAFGELAAGVAHDVNNALSPVVAYTELIARHEESDNEVRRMASYASEAADDAARIIRKMQPLYRDSSSDIQLCDLQELIKRTIELARTACLQPRYAGKEIEIRNDAQPILLACSPTDIRELLLNLIMNAADAIESEGTVAVGCHGTQDAVVLTVADTGSGMDEETKAGCFSAFYSTKGEFGSGLGLSTTRGIVDSLGGTIELDSWPGIGTEFRITLPLDVQRDINLAIARLDASDTLRGHHVLLVDDVDTTRESIRSLLEALGQRVTEASDTVEAIVCLANDPTITVVMTDHGMPGRSGSDLCKQLHREMKHLSLVLMTGAEQPGMSELCDSFVAKPVSLDELENALLAIQANCAPA